MAIRFHLDEQLSPAIAHALRREGIDVSTSQERSLLGENDQDQLAFAISEQRTLVTCDSDFLREEVVQAAEFGICYCHPRKYPIGELARALLLVANCLTEKEMRYHIEWL